MLPEHICLRKKRKLKEKNHLTELEKFNVLHKNIFTEMQPIHTILFRFFTIIYFKKLCGIPFYFSNKIYYYSLKGIFLHSCF